MEYLKRMVGLDVANGAPQTYIGVGRGRARGRARRAGPWTVDRETGPALRMRPTIDPGLCVACLHGRPIRSARGSSFWLCRRSATDPAFPRYPGLPVVACRGFEPDAEAGASVAKGPSDDDH